MWHAKVGEKAEPSNFNRIQDDSQGWCHPERSAGSAVQASSQPASCGLANFWRTSGKRNR